MKTKFLKIEKSCKENWANMKPNERGRFCKLCSKSVFDFTQNNQLQISKEIKNNGNLCARLTSEQLKIPLVELKNYNDYKLPYTNVAAGLMIATTLSCNQNLPVTNSQVQTEFVQTTNKNLKSEKHLTNTKSNTIKPKNSIKFSGIVTSENGDLIENAKITFATVNKLLSTYSSLSGTFSIDLPIDLIDNDNVIRVSYKNIKNPKKDDERFFGYETTDYVLTKNEISAEYKIKATPIELILGGIGHYSEDWIPIVLSNGTEIKYKEFIKAQQGKKSSCSLENKDFYYFEPKSAVAIYGEKAKYGLYILNDKE
ncbi:hypothetical protein [Aquimarina pacifica]|uniref:hypothetical protein n=1 Tax=Aquimarina pacifica TaxID=1296415 RepID=UPI0004725F63|nr:hypothetical protein [Aquimarina pacifica]